MLNRSIVSFALFISCSYSWAACTPETINFYLEKGFTQEQITKLCSQATDSAPSYQPYQKPIVIYQEGYEGGRNKVEERKAATELSGSIDGRSVDVTDTHISYIRKVCIRAGNSPEKEQRVNTCIDVAFSIDRDGLRVADSGAAFLLFGQQTVSISSNNITRKYVTSDPWDAYSPDIRFLLERKYKSQETGNTTDLPLRRNSSPPNVVSAIRTLSSATELQKAGSSDSEVAKVLDDDYVPPTQEEYIKSQPTLDEIKKEEKKNKKWWNPFD